MRCLKGIIAAAVILLIAGTILMFSGVINVAATDPHNPVTAFILGTTADNSVRYHAEGLSPTAFRRCGYGRGGVSPLSRDVRRLPLGARDGFQ